MSRSENNHEISNQPNCCAQQEDVEIQLSKLEPQAAALFVSHFTTNNQKVLGCTCFLFFVFCVAAFAGAIIGNSLSLLGDAAAMLVDVFTYFCNMYAEYLKSKHEKLSYRTKVMIEIVAPSFSVMALLSVTMWILIDAVITIQNPAAVPEDNVNVIILWCFASVNMVIDIVSFFLFYRKREDVFVEQETHLLGPSSERSTINNNTNALPPTDINQVSSSSSSYSAPSPSHHYNHSIPNNDGSLDNISTNNVTPKPLEHQGRHNNNSGCDCEQQQQQQQLQEEIVNNYEPYPMDANTMKRTPRINMNMASAFTHVGADTLRTLAVFVAAAISTATNADSTLCDAWAAIVVSITIAIAVIPLVHEIYRTILQHLNPKSVHHHSHPSHATAANSSTNSNVTANSSSTAHVVTCA